MRDTVPEIRFLNYSSRFTQIDVAAQIEVGLHNISYFSEIMEVFNITHYPQNVLDRTAKNVKLFKIWQRLALARAGLEVTKMKQTDKSNKEGLFQDAFRRQCKVVFDNFQTLMPCDVTTDKLL